VTENAAVAAAETMKREGVVSSVAVAAAAWAAFF